MVSLIPDGILLWVYYAFLATGFFLYAGSKLAKHFPFNLVPILGQYRLVSELLGVVLLALGIFCMGGYSTEMAWREKQHQLELQIQQMEEQSHDLNQKLEEERKKKQKVRTEYYATVKERIKEVEKIIDGKCVLDPSANEIHNKAATNPGKAK